MSAYAINPEDATSPGDAVPATPRPLRVLIIEDYEEDAVLLARFLTRAGFQLDSRRVETSHELDEALNDPKPWDLVIADYTLPSFGARDALRMIQLSGLDLPFIIVSGTIDEVSAVSAMRAGAHDYVLKGHLERLLPAIERELVDAQRRKERVRNEHELRLAQERFSATFNQAAVGMAHTDTDGRFELANQVLAEMLRIAPEKFPGLALRDFILPSDRIRKRQLLNALIAGEGGGFNVEVSMLRTDGTTFPAQLTVSLLHHASGSLPTVLWVVEDIAPRKEAERETSELMTRLINSERLAAAGRMANTLAHEINNPLEALTNIVYLLQTQGLPPEAQELMEVASRELERVGHITRSTLSFYRKVPGRTLDLHTVLDEVVQLFESRASQHNVKLERRYGDETRAARYDPALRQVFANIVGNALEAMGTGGGLIRVRARIADNTAFVTVSDNGHGIERENMAAIFEPFFTTKGEKGTGLGLWVTRGIVEEQGGTLQLRSCTHGARQGTTIRIHLPVLSQEPGPEIVD